MRLVVVALLVVPVLAGCLQPYNDYHQFDIDDQYQNPAVYPGAYRMGGGGSMVLQAGALEPLPLPEIVRLKSDLPAYFGPLSERDDAEVDIVMAIWRPNTTAPVPVVVDAGPYYEIDEHCRFNGQEPCSQFDDDTIDWPGQSTPANRMNLISHGYAVVQLAVRGTGTAGGCMDLLGPSEAHDLDQATTWLGTQPWSSGKVAMMGVSYDGSTPWIVAGMGNPHLKAIVPISGLPDIYDLMFHNGTPEVRGPIMHNQVYYGFGLDDEFPQRPADWPEPAPWVPSPGVGQANGRTREQDMQHVACPEIVEGSALGAFTTATGQRGGEFSSYWTERDWRQRVIDNYDGGIFLVHGLQDWNVDPHAAIPFNQHLRDAGFDMLEWYGQWAHARPDSNCIPAAPDWVALPCRLDFGETLFRFFERHLKGNMTVQLPPPIQVQDNIGFWRSADSYPPRDATWTELKLSIDERLVPSGAKGGSVDLDPPVAGGPGKYVRFATEPLEKDLHMSGLPQIKLPFEVRGQGGQIGVWMFDEDPRGLVRAPAVFEDQDTREWLPHNLLPHLGVPVIGHAQLNLRFYAGGEEPRPLVPGQVYEAQVELEPLEVRIPAGNRLVLWVFQYQTADHLATPTQAPVTIHLGDDARLRMPVMDVDTRTVFPVPGAHFLNHTYVPQMYVAYPNVPGQVPAPVVAAPTKALPPRQGVVL